MVDLTFELIGNIAVWMFIADVILILLFESSGSQFKWRISGYFNNLNPYIPKAHVILTAIVVIFGMALIQNLTNFIDIHLISLVGNSTLLYLIAFSFDIFYICKGFAGMHWRNSWVKGSLGSFIVLVVISILNHIK